MSNDKHDRLNSSDRMPIVFCLDVSPSMGWSQDSSASPPIDLLNAAVKNFVNDLYADPKVRAAAEIAFVTFSSGIQHETDFESVSTLKVPTFRPVAEGGTQAAAAVLRCFEKVNKRRDELDDMDIHYFAPFFIFVTDGNPDNNDDPQLASKAISVVRSHCDSHVGAEEIIVPFIIGVGDRVVSSTLTDYAAGFTNGYFAITGSAEFVKTNFNKVFRVIGNSTTKSVHLNDNSATARTEHIQEIRGSLNDLLKDINAKLASE